MKTVCHEYYEISDLELPENAAIKAKAIEVNRYCNTTDSWWYESTEEWFHDMARSVGLEITNSNFSGFYSQGDGASFSGTFTPKKDYVAPDNEEFAGLVATLYDLCDKYNVTELNIRQMPSIYCHSNTMTVEFENETEVAYDHILPTVRAIADWYYKELENNYEYNTSDEGVWNALVEEDDILFDENGEIFYSTD